MQAQYKKHKQKNPYAAMQQAAAKENNICNKHLQAGSIDITYYTDPLYCWSWAFEDEWQKIKTIFNNVILFLSGGKISWY